MSFSTHAIRVIKHIPTTLMCLWKLNFPFPSISAINFAAHVSPLAQLVNNKHISSGAAKRNKNKQHLFQSKVKIKWILLIFFLSHSLYLFLTRWTINFKSFYFWMKIENRNLEEKIEKKNLFVSFKKRSENWDFLLCVFQPVHLPW